MLVWQTRISLYGIHYTTALQPLHCSPVLLCTVHTTLRDLYSIALHCNPNSPLNFTARCSDLQWTSPHCMPLHCTAWCGAVHCTVFHNTLQMNFTTFNYNVQCSPLLLTAWCSALHYTSLHNPVIHCILFLGKEHIQYVPVLRSWQQPVAAIRFMYRRA